MRRTTRAVLGAAMAVGLAAVALLIMLAPAAPAADTDDEAGFVPLFNGKDLAGWEGDTKLWLVENGMLIGRSPGIKQNEFLATTKSYGDFILRYQIKLVDAKGNTGVQFRSQRVPNNSEVAGYQADWAPGYWACLYDEARRNRILVKPADEDLKKALKPADWNDYEVVAVGDKITLTLNGVKMVEWTEQEPNIARSGIIATQIHAGEPMEVQFRKMRIKEIK